MKNVYPVGVFALLVLSICSNVFAAVSLNGAGASFPDPLYSKWFSEYRKVDPDTQINYQSIGSGGGIRQFIDKTVDFAASDAPMTDEEIAKAGAAVVHIPTVLGAVAVTYNVPGIKAGLQLNSELLADLFLGKITSWNDPRLAKLNPKLKLPDAPVLVIRRSDGSGTTGIFTDYLAKVSSEWKQKVGAGKAVKWPVGLGGKGNEGVAGLIKQTPGSVGYVEMIYAESNHLSVASLQNKSGAFVAPSTSSVTAAANGVLSQMPADFRVSITDAAGKTAYPISGFTYLLVYQDMPNPVKAQRFAKFLQWSMKQGQKFAPALFYAPLPSSLVTKVEAKIRALDTH